MKKCSLKVILMIYCAIIIRVSSRVLIRQGKGDTVDELIKKGDKSAEIAANVISSPIIILATKTNLFANALPNTLAAHGALVGSAIALPIHLTSSAFSGTASGITGLIIAIPVSIGSTIKAVRGKNLFIRVKSKISNFHNFHNEFPTTTSVPEHTDSAFDENNLIHEHSESGSATKSFFYKPIAIILGAKSAISGAGSYLIGKGLEKIGSTFSSIGNTLVFSGNELRGTGAILFNWGTGHNLPLLSGDDDIMAAINFTESLPEPMKQLVFNALSE